jgi:hypothetical protein
MTRLAPGYGEHRFGGTRVTLSSDGADVVLPNGDELEARPSCTGAAVLTAVKLGYDGNTRAMIREWCYLHAQLCHTLGLPESPTLSGLARNASVTALTRAESEMVVAAQRFLNLWRNGDDA